MTAPAPRSTWPGTAHSRGLWIAAALAALALHLGGVGFGLARLQSDDIDAEIGAPGLEIGLELEAPQAAPSDLPPGPDSEAAAASPAVAEQKAVLKPSDLPKDTPTETDDPDRVVATDSAKKPPQDDPDTPAQQATASTESVASEATAMPTSDTARPSDRSVTLAQGSGATKQRVRTTWQKELVAYLDRHKRYPAERVQKSAEIVVSFVLDRTGHVLSSTIVRSSGDAAFDEAALTMLKRSDPVPPPPPLIADDGLTFTLPVFFKVKGQS